LTWQFNYEILRKIELIAMKLLSQKKKAALILVVIFFLGLGLAYRTSAFSTIRNTARGIYFAASNGKEQFRFTGPVKATVKGKGALTLSIKSFLKENQLILFIGRVLVTGRITPVTPGTAIPTKLRLVVNHRNAVNRILRSSSFDVNVQSNGAILSQSIPFSTFDLINPREILELSVIPLDRNLPASNVSLNMTHVIGASAAPLVQEEEQILQGAVLPHRLIFAFNNFLSGHVKNQVIGPLLLRTPSSPTFYSHGTLRVVGRITPFDGPGIGLPNRFMITFKHKLQQGNKLVKVENFTVRVNPNGTIPPQVFPVDGRTLEVTPNMLEVSMKYLDKNIPDRVVNVTFTFTHLT
jgi:hypothetical protein